MPCAKDSPEYITELDRLPHAQLGGERQDIERGKDEEQVHRDEQNGSISKTQAEHQSRSRTNAEPFCFPR